MNVITGASRTGKSAIIPIIDYCLASSDCYIPIDTIRDHTSWYGIVVQISDEQMLLSRKVPVGNRVSNEFFILRGKKITIPPHISEKNETTEGVKQILNAVTGVPSFKLSGSDDNRSFESRLGFRDLMALVFQSQDIVANQNIIFYKTHAHEHRERLRNWFPYILGAETLEVLIARQRIQSIDKKLSQLRRELQKARLASKSWSDNMLTHLKVAKEYGLIETDLKEIHTDEEMIDAAKMVLQNIPDFSNSSLSSITTSNQEIAKLELEEEKISYQIGATRKRLNDITQLKSGFVEYGLTSQKRADRLSISNWLIDMSENSQDCIVCGSKEHSKSSSEVSKIASLFKVAEKQASIAVEVPTSLAREEENLKTDLEELLNSRKPIQEKLKILRSNDKEAQRLFQNQKSMFLYLGHLKASMEMFTKASDDGDLSKEIGTLEKEYNELQRKINPESLKQKLESACLRIAQGILNHLKTLDVEEKYRAIAPRFSTKDLNISVLSDDNHWHYIAEVGSASNWVSFHIALMCSLQEFFLGLPTSSVPSFVIFDQPSQVYFPRLKKESTDELIGKNVDRKFADEDVEAVKSIFKTLATSVSSNKGEWQCIVLDHADKSIYGQIEHVHEVEEWRNGKKLIPVEWYEMY